MALRCRECGKLARYLNHRWAGPGYRCDVHPNAGTEDDDGPYHEDDYEEE